MANTIIKITQLPNIGANLNGNTLLPVVSTNGTAVTDKVSVSNIANYMLTEAGNTLLPAFVANVAYSVANAAQPNITSVGTLSVDTLHISGGDNGYVLQTDGTGNLNWTAMEGSGNGNPGGANTQVQYNDEGNFGAEAGFTYNKTTNMLTVGNLTVTANASIDYLTLTHDVHANVVYGNYLYGDGSNISNITVGAGSYIQNGSSNVKVSASGNVTVSVAGNANIITATGTGANIAGTLSVSGNANVGNLGATGLVVATISATGNANVGNVNANIMAANTANVVGNINAANANITATANVFDLNVSNVANLGFPSHVKILGGTNGYVLSTNGGGALSWVAQAVSNYGNSNVADYLPTYDGSIGVGAESSVGSDVNNNLSFSATPSELVSLSSGNLVGIVAGSGRLSPKEWVFNPDGSIRFPDTTVQTTAYTGGGGVNLVPNDVTYTNGDLYGINNPGFTIIVTEDDDAAYQVPTDFPIQFLGNSYSNGNIFLVSNSYLTFGPDSYDNYSPVGPGVVPVPAIFVGAADLSNQKYYYGYADGTDVYVIGFEGSIETGGQPGFPGIQWEMQVSASTPDQIKIVVTGPNDGVQLNFPAGVWGVSDGVEWVDQFNPLPWYSQYDDNSYNAITIAPVTPVTVDTIAFTGTGVTMSENDGVTYVNINPFDNALAVTTGGAGTIVSSVYYGLTLTTARSGEDLVLAPLGDLDLQPQDRSENQPGSGFGVYIQGGAAHDDPNSIGTNYNGGNVVIQGGNPVNSGIPGYVDIKSNNLTWRFNGMGETLFPVVNTARGDNPSGTISGYTLNMGDGTQEAIITTPDGATGRTNSQRLVINPGKGADGSSGEGGDIYLWAGRGGNGDGTTNGGSGGDIKIRGGQGMSQGDGGYIKMEAGDSNGDIGGAGYIQISAGQTTGGTPGYVNIAGGYNYSGIGGDVGIYSGYGSTNSGNINVSTPNASETVGAINLAGGQGLVGGAVNLTAGQGSVAAGNITITGGSTTTFTSIKGGAVSIVGGYGEFGDGGGGPGGDVLLLGGDSSDNVGGNVILGGGEGATGSGNIFINNRAFMSTIAQGPGIGEAMSILGSRTTVGGTDNPFPYAATLPGAGSPTLCYQATNNSVQSAKLTFAVQSNGIAANWEQFDVAVVAFGGEAIVSVSNRVRANATIDWTEVTANTSSGIIQVYLTQPTGQTVGYVNYQATEFNLMVD